MSSRPELKLDKGDETGFIAFFRALTKSLASSSSDNINNKTILIFDRGDYYTAHGHDAIYIAQNVYRTLSVVKYLGNRAFSTEFEKGLPSVSLSQLVFQNFLKDALLNQGLKVQIYAQNSSNSHSSNILNSWKVVKQASPGNLHDVEDLLDTQVVDSNPVVIALKVLAKADSRTVGVCFINSSPTSAPTSLSELSSEEAVKGSMATKEIGIFEFADNDLFSNLESLVIQLGVKECILPVSSSSKQPGDNADLLKIVELLNRCDVTITERKSSDFNTRDVEQDLSKLLKRPSNSSALSVSALPEVSLTNAMAATAALIKYLGVMSIPDESFGQYQLVRHDLSQFMKLDSAAIKALNLMPTARDGSNKNMSLFGLLNHCKTAAGTRLLGQWLKQPLMDLEEIKNRQSLVGAFLEDSILKQNLQEECLKSIPDIGRMLRKFQKQSATLEDVVRIYQMVIKMPDIIAALEGYESQGNDEEYNIDSEEKQKPVGTIIKELYTDPIKLAYGSLEKLQELVETTVDLEALDRHEFIIKPDFDERLQVIHSRLAELESLIRDEHLRAGDDLGMDPERKLKLENHHVYGWSFRLTRTDASCLRTHKGYIELSTQKAGVYFTSRALKSLSEESSELSAEYNKTQSSLVKEVVEIVSTYAPVLEHLSMTLAHLDVIVSFAHAASLAPIPYTRPIVHPRGTGNTILKEARHPCLEMQDDVSFIPNDVSLVRGKSEFLIITGPNMGGKSTYIRQIGVIALMAQIGSYVPCDEGSELCIFDCILARVGAGDSQLKGVSTFMAEMLETASILKTATRESLIVIDELGRGTSTYDGFGLAWAITEHIVKKISCFGMFATHFHELTGLAKLYPNQVENLHVLAHVGEVDNRLAMETSHNPLSTNGKAGDEFQSPSITLLYKVEPGISDQSFGIHVAEVVKFPPKVIRMAKRKAFELEDFERDEEGSSTSELEILSLPSSQDGNGPLKKPKTKPQFSETEIHEGSELLKQVLKAWMKSLSKEGSPALDESSNKNGDNKSDEFMFDHLSKTQILESLKSVVEEGDWKAKLDANPFVQSIMNQL